MKSSSFFIILFIVLAIYISCNLYILIRGIQALPQITYLRILSSISIILPAAAFIFGEYSEKTGLLADNRILIIIGSIWLAFLLYTVLLTFAIDLVRGLNYFFNFLPDKTWMEEKNIPLKLMGFITSVTTVIVLTGYIIASSPVIRTLDIEINKNAGNINNLNIVMAADIHLGNIIGTNKLSKLVKKINSLNPDIVLFPGDIFDETLKPVVKNNHGEILESIESKYGVYAVTGNHEYIGGVKDAVKYLLKHNVDLLRDEKIIIDNSFVLIGREDLSMGRFTDKTRKNLDQILDGVDRTMPLILLDHQPYSINESVKTGIDLHLSGHTHNGQLWPFNYITRALYIISHGYLKVDNTHIYVTNGYGTWGPPVRTTGRPEIVNIRVSFAD